MKHFCGARKLYVRLYICKDVISGSFSDDSDITSLPLMLPPNNNNNNNNNYCRSQVCSTSTAHSVAVVDEIPSTPSGRVVNKSRQPAKFAGFSARFRRLLSLLHESKHSVNMSRRWAHNRLLFTKLRLLKNLKKTLFRCVTL